LNALANISHMSVVPEPRVHRWTRAEYDERVAAGFFDDLRVELLDGELIDMAPTSNRHFRTVTAVHNVLVRTLDPTAFLVGSQGPLALSDASEPEPDVLVMRQRANLLVDDHAQPADIVLVVEVSLSSWGYDSGRKLAAYARGGLPEVWLVNLNTNTVHVCRRPVDDQYTERFTVDSNGTLTVPEADITIAVAAFLS
jgi:Uma2 family endonuclease